MTVIPAGVATRGTMLFMSTLPSPVDPLTAVRLRVVGVAVALGWASVAVVLATALLPGARPVAYPGAVLALAGAAAVGNGILALLPWPRLVVRPVGDALFTLWAVGLTVLAAALTYVDGGWRSDSWLLYFLVIPFVALTESRGRQVALSVLALAGYALAVLLFPDPVPPGVLVVRLGVLAGAAVLADVVARIVEDNAVARAQAENEARMERLLAVEAHHRIKNNLQLVADLLSLQAAEAGADLDRVVAETLSRIQSVAAVQQALARRGGDRVRLLPVVERIVRVLGDRLAEGRSLTVTGDATEVGGDQATRIALVVNELVTNALRHGRGAVHVRLATVGDALRLRVVDQGPGPTPPDGVQGGGGPQAPAGLGTALVQRLVADGLGGATDARPTADGYEVRVSVPLLREVARARADR